MMVWTTCGPQRKRNDLLQRDRLERIRAALQTALATIDDELAECAETPDNDRLITPKEGAFLLGVSQATVYRWQATHPDKLGVLRVGGKIVLSQRLLVAFARGLPREK